MYLSKDLLGVVVIEPIPDVAFAFVADPCKPISLDVFAL